MEFTNKKILVLGAGISGIAVAQILQRAGAYVTLNDAKPKEEFKKDFSFLENQGIELLLGRQDQALLDGVDILVVSPGISIYIPLIETARKRAIAVMSEIEIAYRLCKAPIIAITGTNGKTTTTTLVGEMVKTTGLEIVVGGNIGAALSQEAQGVSSAGLVVAEISSFQLEGSVDFRPKIAAILNITPDHIDRHRTMEGYIQAKERIFMNQQKDDYLVLNYDDSQVREMAAKTSAQVMFFSRKQELATGVFVKNNTITINWSGNQYEICQTSVLKIRGDHNIENALAAAGIAFLAGVKIKNIANTLHNFQGVEHRIEPVATINDVDYYNDSKATNPESSIKALEAFPGHIILIAGGRDKKTDLTEFMQSIKERVDHLILLGEARERFEAAATAAQVSHIHTVNSFADAVKLAHSLARPPQVVLLSPACSSYDMFNNFEERGRAFKELVCQLR